MFEGLNAETVIVGSLVGIAVIMAVIAIIRAKKNGNHGCGGNCVGCAMCGSCHQNTKGGKEEYATTFHEIEKRLIVTYIHYGTYMKTSSKKDPRSAKMALEKVLNFDKHNSIANYRLGFLAYQDEHYFEALRYFQTALHCESKLEPNEFKLNETQLYYAQLYSANSALYIAQQSQQAIEQFTQQPKPLTYETSPLLSLIERNEGYLTEHAFYSVTRNTKETCSIDDCSQILEDDLKEPHLILYFADRGPIIKYIGEERSINYPDADILFQLLTRRYMQQVTEYCEIVFYP